MKAIICISTGLNCVAHNIYIYIYGHLPFVLQPEYEDTHYQNIDLLISLTSFS